MCSNCSKQLGPGGSVKMMSLSSRLEPASGSIYAVTFGCDLWCVDRLQNFVESYHHHHSSKNTATRPKTFSTREVSGRPTILVKDTPKQILDRRQIWRPSVGHRSGQLKQKKNEHLQQRPSIYRNWLIFSKMDKGGHSAVVTAISSVVIMAGIAACSIFYANKLLREQEETIDQQEEKIDQQEETIDQQEETIDQLKKKKKAKEKTIRDLLETQGEVNCRISILEVELRHSNTECLKLKGLLSPRGLIEVFKRNNPHLLHNASYQELYADYFHKDTSKLRTKLEILADKFLVKRLPNGQLDRDDLSNKSKLVGQLAWDTYSKASTRIHHHFDPKRDVVIISRGTFSADQVLFLRGLCESSLVAYEILPVAGAA